MIKLASDLDGYEYVESFYPYMSSESEQEMDAFIAAHQLVDDPTDMFHLVSVDRFFVMVFHDSGHERDSSNDHYTVYRRKMSG